MEVETRRDEKDPVFLALVLSVLASAMVQVCLFRHVPIIHSLQPIYTILICGLK